MMDTYGMFRCIEWNEEKKVCNIDDGVEWNCQEFEGTSGRCEKSKGKLCHIWVTDISNSNGTSLIYHIIVGLLDTAIRLFFPR